MGYKSMVVHIQRGPPKYESMNARVNPLNFKERQKYTDKLTKLVCP